MNNIEIVERMKLDPHIFIDCGFRQGRDILAEKLDDEFRENAEDYADAFIIEAQQRIMALIQKAKPYIIPKDYIFFLEYYGGLAIENEKYYFSTLGIGPMVEDHYSSIDSDDAYPGLVEREGVLPIGDTSFRQGKYKYQYISFFLDLSGKIRKNSVIQIGPWGAGTPTPEMIFIQKEEYPDLWHIIAGSFIEWLEHIVETEGGFGYA